MKVKITGIQSIIIFWVGSGGAGLSFICSHMVNPMTSGQAPSIRNGPSSGRCEGSQGINPNRLNTVVGSGADKSLIRSEEHTSELQSRGHLVCRLLLEKKNKT